MKAFRVSIILLFIMQFAFPAVSQQTQDLTVTILYDNYKFKDDLQLGWGFSCLINGTEKTILFDIASYGVISNMQSLNIDLKSVDVVVFSHPHSDHTDGALLFWYENKNILVYIPESWPVSVKDVIKKSVASCIETREPLEICKNVYLTEDMATGLWGSGTIFGVFVSGEAREQALAIDTTEGLVVVTGCAHPGIVNIVKRVKEITKKDKVFLLLGGLHLLDKSEQQIKDIISQLKNEKVERVSPTHCTGDLAISLFKEEYKENYVPAGVGNKINVKNAFLLTPVDPKNKLALKWALIKTE